MFYLDTSVIVAALVNEEASERASAFLWEAVNTTRVVVSDWTLTEFSSAIALKIRTGQLNSDYQAEIQNVFDGLVTETFELIPVERRHFLLAAKLAAQRNVNLRASDALHLAISEETRTELVTLDRRMAEAGAALEIAARLI
ncbi:type II toxin-antitoxin system VapC family toxin [Rhizobium sp. BG4]|uniref:type II toxin-antitoxin system VapC family toxin n=1 Tax=Rhizobium sp. BG4 TaxID=2613770 RepID=UPI000DDAE07E|nr:type II toxin-antitoxin system VapC family toxin [Rhizobium sp. BG4]QRM46220.1 type II toxin-antitoxin system VapC family toxin [Rhizobium sp. BG4]